MSGCPETQQGAQACSPESVPRLPVPPRQPHRGCELSAWMPAAGSSSELVLLHKHTGVLPLVGAWHPCSSQLFGPVKQWWCLGSETRILRRGVRGSGRAGRDLWGGCGKPQGKTEAGRAAGAERVQGVCTKGVWETRLWVWCLGSSSRGHVLTARVTSMLGPSFPCLFPPGPRRRLVFSTYCVSGTRVRPLAGQRRRVPPGAPSR